MEPPPTCDEPLATDSQPQPLRWTSQPGRWVPRPRPERVHEGEILITHPDSWFFLRALYPEPFRRMALSVEAIYRGPPRHGPRTWLRDPQGQGFSLGPWGGPLPKEATAWVRQAQAERIAPPFSPGLLVLSRLERTPSFHFWAWLDEAALARLERIGGAAFPVRDPWNRLLALREHIWGAKWREVLRRRSSETLPPSLGTVLGWLAYPDRVLLVRRLLGLLGGPGLRALVYERSRQAPHSLEPDPAVSFPLLLDSLPRQERLGWRYWRVFPEQFPGNRSERLLEVWETFLTRPALREGLSEAGRAILQGLVLEPLREHYRRQTLALKTTEELARDINRVFGLSSSHSVFQGYTFTQVAQILWKSPGAWRLLRHHVSRRAVHLIEEEMAYFDCLERRGELPWPQFARQRATWMQHLGSLNIVKPPETP